MKQIRNSALAAGLLALAAVSGDAGAQQTTVFSLSPNGVVAGGASTNRGIAGPAVAPSRTLYNNAPQTVFLRDGVPTYFPAQYSNGRVYANFGAGYEVVSRSCSTTYSSGVSTYVGGYVTPTYYPVYYPYGPVEGSAGYPSKMYVSQRTSQYVTTTCYERDGVGRLLAYRY